MVGWPVLPPHTETGHPFYIPGGCSNWCTPLCIAYRMWMCSSLWLSANFLRMTDLLWKSSAANFAPLPQPVQTNYRQFTRESWAFTGKHRQFTRESLKPSRENPGSLLKTVYYGSWVYKEFTERLQTHQWRMPAAEQCSTFLWILSFWTQTHSAPT